MGLKNKVFGTLAAAALTLSMFGSAAANDFAHGSVVLEPGTCQVQLAATNVDLGAWKYNGALDKYEKQSGGTVSSGLTIIETKPGGSCKVTVNFTGLSLGAQNIGPGHFTVTAAGTTVPLSSAGQSANYDLPGGGPYPVTLTINSVPHTYQPGTYEGDLLVQLVSGA